MVSLKKLFYVYVFGVAYMPYGAYKYMDLSGYYNVFAWWGVIGIFCIAPFIDHMIGRDPANPNDEQVKKMSAQLWYRILPLLAIPAQMLVLCYGVHIFTTLEQFSLVGLIGWIFTCGVVSAVVAIVVAHELIHKDNKLENWSGGLLLALVFYSGFKVEHIHGHHVNVATPEDPVSARFGQSFYQYLPGALRQNTVGAWKLQTKRLGGKWLQWKNELIWWHCISLLILIASIVTYGWMGAVFFLGVSLVAATTLETINYVEHYGLLRRKLESGEYEPVTQAHSWNSNFLLTNMSLFHLQRHSDHHVYAKRRYQVLRHYDESPQMPTGYAGMIVLALVPPLWFKIMNPRVKAYYEGEAWQLTKEQFADAAAVHTTN